MQKLLVTTIAVAIATSAASAQVTFEFVGPGYASGISADGSVVVGISEADYETFHWTAETGVVLLGRATVPVTGAGGGTPAVSDDGLSVSATIIDATNTVATHGLWTWSTGWQELMPPLLPNGGILDNSYGSAWGLSGDGLTVVGYSWVPGLPGSPGHACSWSQATGLVDLSAGTRSSRADGANYDGSVIVGWETAIGGSIWQPVVWVNGVQTILTDVIVGGQADAVTPDGTMIVGMSIEMPYQHWFTRQAAAWRWTGSTWEEELLGNLPGTNAPLGFANARDVTADGSLVVGYNRFTSPFNATGFIWTAETGIIDVEDFLIDNGVTPDPDFDIRTLTGVSDDGTVIVGSGLDLVSPFLARTFIITIPKACALLGDVDQGGQVDGPDIAGFIRAKLNQASQPGDNPACANYGGTLEQDTTAFIADLLAS